MGPPRGPGFPSAAGSPSGRRPLGDHRRYRPVREAYPRPRSCQEETRVAASGIRVLFAFAILDQPHRYSEENRADQQLQQPCHKQPIRTWNGCISKVKLGCIWCLASSIIVSAPDPNQPQCGSLPVCMILEAFCGGVDLGLEPRGLGTTH